MFGILTAESANRATVITTSRFTKESEDFARGKPIDLIDGLTLLSLVQSVQNKPASAEPSDDSTQAPVTPSKIADQPLCPKCNAAMVQRTARKGANAGKSFWGCSNYPKCRGVVSIESEEPPL